ncbi:MAG TPA: DEAD/DEAH box helicase family protein [Bacteroidales bacterium]|nr:DEAD/DEAH box helicase family protein [Bacteroidales bacterium]
MALHKNFPQSPYEILDPAIRWFPADENLRDKGYEKLLPPLVAELRKKVRDWRLAGYDGASETSKILLRWWFLTDHPTETSNGEIFLFQYYFAQREAVETIIWLYEVAKARDKYDLLRFDSSGAVSAGMFSETWTRYVVKMATGSGKTKVLSLILAWCYYHKLYEDDSQLARNFLVITPNIIVLDRIRADFDGLKIFFEDPVLPDNGHQGRNWRDDFQMTLHIQDEIGTVRKTGNIFLTNIHRVYEGATESASFGDPNTSDYFLGKQPVGATNESKLDLGDIVRNVDELIVLNDEAHHIREKTEWFNAIKDIHNKLLQKTGKGLPLQFDVTATPRHDNGAIFVQVVSDYPLVEAIYQNVVKHPVLPDSASRAKLQEQKSADFCERYKDYIHLAYLEWKKTYERLLPTGKKSILFIMTDDTKNCDDLADYLIKYPAYSEFSKDSVLVIHTKNNGEVYESVTGKKEEELKLLRKAANEVDKIDSPYKVIVSVMMLREGWDVRNVTTILGLKALTAQNRILPEQVLGRGLRRMFRDDNIPELVSTIGSDGFMDFVESITAEGVELDYRPMGEKTQAKAPLVVEIDRENMKKDIEKMDIQIPILTPRIYREYKNLSGLDVEKFSHKKIPIKEFSEAEKREIVFRDIASGEITHKTELDSNFIPNYQSVIGYFTQIIMKELRLVSGYDILYGKVKEFIQGYLFNSHIDLDNLNSLRNLSEIEVSRTIFETFKKEINTLTVLDKGEAEIRDYIKISKSRPFVVKDQGYIVPKKSIFNKIIGDSHFELEFASFLENCEDIISYAKNYFAVHFKIDYRNADGSISDYYPDFIVKVSQKEYYVVETKGREDLDDIEKIKRLAQWCVDVNANQRDVIYKMLYIKQEEWDKDRFKNFDEVVRVFGKK